MGQNSNPLRIPSRSGERWAATSQVPSHRAAKSASGLKEPRPGSRSLLPLPAASGVTLMEVLISIFILAVGLLGVAALLPVGGSEIAASVRADRTATVGAAAIREIQTRNFLQTVQWDLTVSPPTAVTMWFWRGSTYSWNPSQVPYLLIDPLGVAAAGAWSFPASAPGGCPTMPRLTLRRGPKGSLGPMDLTTARELFISKDDLLFDIPSDRRQRARVIYRQISSGALSSNPSGYNPTNCRPEFEGNYSWMIMVGPTLKMNPTSRTWQGWLSVIVFYKRNLNLTESEIVMPVTSAAMTEEGGEIVVTLSDPDQAALLQPDRWVLLCTTSNGIPLFQWQRIVAAARPNPTTNQWYVTVVGDARMGPSITPQRAILVEGVVGVFSRLVEVEMEQKYP